MAININAFPVFIRDSGVILMQLEVEAIFENGVFKPIAPVPLPNGTKVKLIVIVKGSTDLKTLKLPKYLEMKLKKIKDFPLI